jgi:hypothetical protein
MARRWGKLEKDFLPKSGNFDISKVRRCQAFLFQILVSDQDTKKFPNCQLAECSAGSAA